MFKDKFIIAKITTLGNKIQNLKNSLNISAPLIFLCYRILSCQIKKRILDFLKFFLIVRKDFNF